jgi:soluble lytic murein transglycosylase
MTIWRKRALIGVSTAAFLTAFAPIGRELEHELGGLKRVAELQLAIERIGEARLAHMLPLPAPEFGWSDQKAPDGAVLARREIDQASTGSLSPSGQPEAARPDGGAETAAPSPDPATRAMPSPPGSPTSVAAVAYGKGDFTTLASLARTAADPDERLGLEWAALRVDPNPRAAELAAFASAHPTWPGAGWIGYRQEAELVVHPLPPKDALAFFEKQPPQSSAGKLAYARAQAASGRVNDATATVRSLWREGNFDGWTENQTLREFGPVLQRADHKYRADRLLYAENFGPALRAAALVGPDMVAVAQARIAASRGPLSAALALAVPQAMRGDPGLLFARIQDARRSGRTYEAATLLDLAPADREALVNRDKWWSERRMVARKLLDLDEPKLAFDLCAKAAPPDQSATRVDQNFHAGWIALRFLDNPLEAATRFALAAQAAQTPLAIARSAYWRGRAAEALGDQAGAKSFYETAAAQPIAYYGQLATSKLGAKRLALREPKAIATGDQRDESVRAVETLYVDGLDDLATSLAYEAARSWTDEAQIAAMAEVVVRYADAATEVQFGKIATLRGLPFDEMAFPSTGVPAFLPLSGSADLASVYAVARQESEFVWRAASGAGAKGLMQILPATAAGTARRAGVAYDSARLLADPSFNTQLGAAFLGQVMGDLDGSPELAFAAYNAGPGRVAQWIAAYGDPRAGKADLVDWIERIPYDETRDYVQRVAENLAVYKQLFIEAPPDRPQLSPRLARE